MITHKSNPSEQIVLQRLMVGGFSSLPRVAVETLTDRSMIGREPTIGSHSSHPPAILHSPPQSGFQLIGRMERVIPLKQLPEEHLECK